MMKYFPVAALLMLFSIITFAADDDQSDFTFTEGSVIIHCVAPTEEAQIGTDVFNEAFPLWITKLQIHANEGRIARAHYLDELKKGIFIVVLGKDRDAAMAQAQEIQAENQEIMKSALDKAGQSAGSFDFDTACDLIEIGPVAILPNK